MKREFTLKDFKYNLPDELIAQNPLEKRDSSRLMVLRRSDRSITRDMFSNVLNYFSEGDLLVFNDARVINARLFFKRESGGAVEVVLSKWIDTFRWEAITNRSKKLKIGDVLSSAADPSVTIEIIGRAEEGFLIETSPEFTPELLERLGNIPLPPYIKREPIEGDQSRYQTVYANAPGAVAAPTAGLHFTEELIASVKERGILSTFVTLFVGLGTFNPVRGDELSQHKMHSERFILTPESAELINGTRARGGKIISVGTTSLRVLESTFEGGINSARDGETNIFIYPPYEVKSADALITNFHTPESTLLMLVSAFAGYEFIMESYRTAVEERYRFFSYGDATLIL